MSKRDSPDAQTLSSQWCPPARVPTGIGEVGRPLACVASTYTFHAQFFETELLPRFLGLKFDNSEGERPFVIEREQALGTTRAYVLVDQDHVDASQTTLRWDQIPVHVPGGVQHSKVTLLVWERWVRLIVASANLTREGYRRNREIVAIVDFYDEESSAPLQLALDAIEFMDAVVDWGRTASEAKDRVRQSLNEARNRLKRWYHMPRDFTSRDYPCAFFVAGLPGREGVAVASPMEKILQIWGNRRVEKVTVMTPFVGDIEGLDDPVIDRLMALPRSRDAMGYLVVPGCPSERDASKMLVSLPRRFLEAWAAAWRVAPNEVPVYVVPLCREARGEKVNRDLHAKAVLISGDGVSLLLCGSSNFSPHGMGIGCTNIEANLCYLDKCGEKCGGVRLEDRLPVDWEEDCCEDAVWPEVAEPPEDLPSPAPRLPDVFLWVMYDQRSAQLTLGLDTKARLPAEWSLRLPGERGEEVAPLLDHRQLAVVPADGRFTIQLTNSLRGANITCLRLSWRGPDGKTATAILPVQTRNTEDLLPPEEFRAMTADSIIECLISGRDAAEWVESQDRLNSGGKSSTDVAVESLHAVDTSGFTLYRVRRLGRALATLGERLVKTVRTRDAMAYRLTQDPLGPCVLAEALAREWDEKGPCSAQDRSHLVFALAEIALSVAHAGWRVHSMHEAGEADLRPLFRDFVAHIEGLWKAMEVGSNGVISRNLSEYVSSVMDKSEQLLGKPSVADSHAG